jgi:predicted acyl esterase
MMIAGIMLKAGSRIRLDITSSDFPTFDRNHNTGRPFYSDPELRVANQTLFFGPAHPSHLTLPVVGKVWGAINAG